MMDTTTPAAGGLDEPQPQTNEAVAETATVLEPTTVEPSSQSQSNEAVEEAQPVENEAEPADPKQANDVTAWAEKKGLPLDDPVKLAQMYRDAEKKMHEAIEQRKELETTMVNNPTLEYTGDEAYDALALEVNQLKIQNRVADYFRANPEAREYETKMAEIVQQRPHLQNDLDALYALAVNSPDRAAELKSEGGREALTNLAQKQAAIPPAAQASNPVATTDAITPDNVDELVAKNGPEWFKKNYDAINRAMASI